MNEFFEGLIIGKGSGSLLQGNVENFRKFIVQKRMKILIEFNRFGIL